MSTRVKPLITGSGRGTPAETPGGAILRALLEAASLSQVAQLASDYALVRLGAQHCGLYWRVHSAGEAPVFECWPADTPGSAAAQLAEAALAAPTALCRSDGQLLRCAATLGRGDTC